MRKKLFQGFSILGNIHSVGHDKEGSEHVKYYGINQKKLKSDLLVTDVRPHHNSD